MKRPFFVLLASFATWGPAAATPDCPEGNLLHGRTAIASQELAADPARLTDHFVAPEGTPFDGPQAVVFKNSAAAVTWDLSRPYELRYFVAQADGNDTYQLAFSLDGKTFEPLATLEATGERGLRRRTFSLAGTTARYLRLGSPQGDGAFAVAELQAFCTLPSPFPPKIPVFVTTLPAPQRPFWNNDSSARWELILALLGLLVLLWRRFRPRQHPLLQDRLLFSLGVIALLTYFNFGAFHFPKFIHDWEWTHYYLGAKYFEELDYDKLYECIAVADSEAGLAKQVAARKLTNLRTNVLESTAEILAHPERCKAEFSAARWQNFEHDVGFFRDRQTSSRWEDLQTDHGYNATPVWNIAGSLLANTGAASRTQLYLLALLDPLYLLALVGLVVWAFGWRPAAIALLVLATQFPARFYWTGGSFLRWDWLFFTVAALCLLKKERPWLAGLSLGYAALLRIFPLLIFAGPLLAALPEWWRSRRLAGPWLRFFAGAALAAAILLPLGAVVGGGADVYRKFTENTLKHKETPLTNHMGLRTLVAYRPSEAGHLLHDGKATDPWLSWKKARLAAYLQAKPIYLALVLLFAALLAVAVRGREAWIAAALGISFIPIGVELTCYYYAFLIGIALLHQKNNLVGPILLAVGAATQFVDWRPLQNMPAWRDEQYTLMSAATIAGLVTIVALFARRSTPDHAKITAPTRSK